MSKILSCLVESIKSHWYGLSLWSVSLYPHLPAALTGRSSAIFSVRSLIDNNEHNLENLLSIAKSSIVADIKANTLDILSTYSHQNERYVLFCMTILSSV